MWKLKHQNSLCVLRTGDEHTISGHSDFSMKGINFLLRAEKSSSWTRRPLLLGQNSSSSGT